MYFSGLPAPVVTTFHHYLGHIIGVGAEQHHVHAKRLIRQLLGLADLGAHHLARRVGSADQSEAARLGYGRSQIMLCYPGHAALNNRIFNP